MPKKIQPFLYSIIGAVLLSLAWYLHPLFIFVGFVPILLLEDFFAQEGIKKSGLKFFFFTYLDFFLWNLATTWWIALASIAGAIFAIVINSLLMCIPIFLFRITKKQIAAIYGYFSLVLYWLSFEYFHLNWELSWTWLNLGNVFAFTSSWVQWYSLTGVLGGTLWILLVNLIFFIAWQSQTKHNQRLFVAYGIALILLGIGTSAIMYFTWEQPEPTVEAVLVQPNIDPYEEIFIDNKKKVAGNTKHLIDLAKQQITPETEILLFPEATLSDLYYEERVKEYNDIKKISALKEKSPKVLTITGLTSYTIYPDSVQKPSTSRFKEGIGHYDMFNAAVIIDEKQRIDFYHKSLLVPGIEQFPYASVLSFLAPIVESAGGSFFSFGTQKEREVFEDNEKRKWTALICYESIFGEYTARFVRNGATSICIITNDAWWGNTPGHIQHFHYSRLRAIETRRWVLRAANTGISGIISPQGKIIQRSNFWETDVLKGKITPHTQETFYVKYGDYLGRVSWFLAVGLFLTGLVRKRAGKKSLK